MADPEIARGVLANAEGLYREHSDFFHTRFGQFGPREVQVVLGKEVRKVLRGHSPGIGLAGLESVSRWPDAANMLVYKHFRSALVRPGTPAVLRGLVDDVVRHAVLAGARERRSRLERGVLRWRVVRALRREIRARAHEGGEPRDVLGVVASVCPAGADARVVERHAEVFLSCLFAVAGSVGFLTAWAVYLWGTEGDRGAAPGDVVREAARLWPVAWLFGRTPARRHEVGGVVVTPEDEVLVCGYLVQRDGRYWDEPDAFRPTRWADAGSRERGAYLPFGWGTHACTGAALAVDVAEAVLTALVEERAVVVGHGGGPQVAAALAPPVFTVERNGRR